MVATICYRSAPAKGAQHSVRQKSAHAPLWSPPMPACWPFASASAFYKRLDRPGCPWQWGLGAAKANHYRIGPLASAQASLATRGRKIKPRVWNAETRGSKDADGAKKQVSAAGAIKAVPSRVSASARWFQSRSGEAAGGCSAA